MHRGRGDPAHASPMGSDDEDVEPGSSAINPIGLPLSQLKRLKTKFVDPRTGKMMKLMLDEFVEALTSNQRPCESERQKDQLRSELCVLFKKIDASCTETVDWEEFTEYMLLHMPGLNVGGEGSCELSHGPVDASGGFAAAWGAGHSDMISSVAVIHDIGPPGGGAGSGGAGGRRYVTAGRDGFLKVWLPNLTVHKAIDVGQHKGRWLTACCWMSKSRRLAVASSNFRIFFYESTFAGGPVTYIDHKDGTPLCLGYRESTESDGREKEILMVGDDNGFVTVYLMDDDWTSHESKLEGDSLPFKKKPIRRQYHEGWVTKVGFVYELQYMVTCGLDGEINLCDVHTNTRKGDRPPIRLHKKYGVHCWCWCGSYKFFASGGLDRQIIIWNPYTQMAINYLQGHNAPILDLQVNEAQHQLISMSVDKVIKVWDIQHYRCISTFTDKTEYKPEDKLTCMAFDEEMPGLVMCSSTLNVLPVSVKVETNRTHVAPIVGALYNDVFSQVVSGDSLGTVCVWDVRTGHLEFEFRRAHGDHKLTCMALDVSKRRLYTGAEDGEARLWNFSSGQHLKTYTMKSPSEINGLLWAQTALASPEGPNTFVVALAWDRKIYVWPGTAKSSSGNAIEPKYVLEDVQGTGHTDDISCVVAISTVGGLLATGGDDGNVVFWKIQETSTSTASPIAAKLTDTSGDGAGTAAKGEAAARAAGGAAAPSAGAPRRKRQAGGSKQHLPSITGTIDFDGAAAAQSTLIGVGAGVPSSTTLQASPGKVMKRGSLVPGQGLSAEKESPSLGGGSAAAGAAGAGGAGEAREHKAIPEWPEELGFEDEHASMATAAVEHMLFLEHKDCLLSTHADRNARLWSHRRSAFLQHLELEMAPLPPAEAEEAAASSAAWGGDHVAPTATPAHATSSSSSGLTAAPAVATAAAAAGAGREVPAAGGPVERVPVTALYTDKAENRWLFTGDQDGYVRVWDLTQFYPPTSVRRLPRLHEMQPHRQSITHLQHFVLEDEVFIMSASQDWTISLSTLDGQRIGTFNGKGERWALFDRTSWCPAGPAVLDEPPVPHEEMGWMNARRGGGKGGGSARHGHGHSRGPAADTRVAMGSSLGTLGMRTPRGTQTRTRPVVAAQAHCGRGIFKMLSAVDRAHCKPDLTVASHEQQFLIRSQLRADP